MGAEAGAAQRIAGAKSARVSAALTIDNGRLAAQQVSPVVAYAAAIGLFSRSAPHRNTPLCVMDAIVTEALRLGQLKLYFTGDQPTALALWAYSNETVEARLLSDGAGLRPSELKVGDRLWVADVVAPASGGESVRADLAVTLFTHGVYRELRVAERQRAKDRGPPSVSTVNASATYTPTRREDMSELASRLRQQDIAEIRACHPN